MSAYYAFIDESGNTDINTDKAGASKYYVVAAVILREEQLDSISESVELLRYKFYGVGEIKSSKTKNPKRIAIINELLNINFKFVALIVHKDELCRSRGFKFKTSFVKYLHGILYKSLIENYQDVSINADEYGRDEFMKGFREYIRDQHITDLFRTCTVTHVKSNESILVQLADFLAGTISNIYEKKSDKNVVDAFMNLVEVASLSIDEWPPQRFRIVDSRVEANDFDKVIFELAMNKAANFIEHNSRLTDDEIFPQLLVVKHLLLNARFGRSDYISAAAIISHLESLGIYSVSENNFQSSVISKLRDKGVLISSSTQGYKIPQTYRDYMDFVDLVNRNAIPLLDRLKLASDALYQASMGEIKTFEDPQYNKLKNIIESLKYFGD